MIIFRNGSGDLKNGQICSFLIITFDSIMPKINKVYLIILRYIYNYDYFVIIFYFLLNNNWIYIY